MREQRLRRARVGRAALPVANGLTLAAAVNALESVPSFARSRVDGYAVVAADVASASRSTPVRLRVTGDVAMGAIPSEALSRGCAMRVPTGGALPGGADGAVMIEDAAEADGIAQIFDGAEAVRNVTAAGADVRAGDPLFAAGTVITPARAGLLAAAGIFEVEVYEPPRIGLLLTGDELVGPSEPIQPGQIRDVNRYSLSAALSAMGFAPQQYDRVADELDAFKDAFAQALEESDGIVISGASSAGERDYAPEVIASAGKPGIVVHHVRAKPGRPTLLGVIGDTPVIGLPGNPVSALVMLETLGKPVLLRLLGREPANVAIKATLTRAIDLGADLEHRVPVRLHRVDGEAVTAEPLFGTSAQMHILAFADALVAVPLGAGRIEAGSVVDAIPLSTSILQ